MEAEETQAVPSLFFHGANSQRSISAEAAFVLRSSQCWTGLNGCHLLLRRHSSSSLVLCAHNCLFVCFFFRMCATLTHSTVLIITSAGLRIRERKTELEKDLVIIGWKKTFFFTQYKTTKTAIYSVSWIQISSILFQASLPHWLYIACEVALAAFFFL